MRRHATGSLLTALAVLQLVGGIAEARPTVKAELYQSNGKQRLVVTVAQSRPFTARNRPTSVVVRYARASYRLRDMTPRSRSRSRPPTETLWQNAAGAAASVGQLAGKRVVVTVRSAGGSATFRTTVAPPPVIFDPPPQTTRGDEAFRRIKQFFVNSRFTDCPAGWPSCSSEQQINHCAGGDMSGSWQRREFPPTVTSDVRGSYRITDAFQSTSGSWGVTYDVTLASGETGTYVWSVMPDGRASGGYEVGTDRGILTGFRWQQPAGC
jgi:hypothetical protein